MLAAGKISARTKKHFRLKVFFSILHGNTRRNQEHTERLLNIDAPSLWMTLMTTNLPESSHVEQVRRGFGAEPARGRGIENRRKRI